MERSLTGHHTTSTKLYMQKSVGMPSKAFGKLSSTSSYVCFRLGGFGPKSAFGKASNCEKYGKASVEMYKENLDKLYQRFKECLPKECLVLWNATLPISKDAKGGFIIPEIEFMNSTLRLDVLEANFYARQIIFSNGYDFFDLHYYLRGQLQRRVSDSIHWDITTHRRITNLILTHLAEA